MFDIKCPKCEHEFDLHDWQEKTNHVEDEFEYQCPKCNDEFWIQSFVSFSFEVINNYDALKTCAIHKIVV